MLTKRLQRTLDRNIGRDWTSPTAEPVVRDRLLGSSEVSQCLRHTWAEKHGVTPSHPDQPAGYYARGNNMEGWITQLIRDTFPEYEVEYTDDEQLTLIDPVTKKVCATPDGLMWRKRKLGTHTLVPSSYTQLEVKTVDPRTDFDNLPRPRHVTQFRIAMALMREVMGITPRRGILLYVDASNWRAMEEFVVRPDGGKALRDARKRADKLFSVNDMLQLPAEGAMTQECGVCPYRGSCYRETQSPVTDPAKLDKLEELAEQYRGFKIAQKGDDEKLTAIRTEILELMGWPCKLDTENALRLSSTWVKGRTTLDRAALEAAKLIDLEPFMKTGTGNVRLLVSPTKKDL